MLLYVTTRTPHLSSLPPVFSAVVCFKIKRSHSFFKAIRYYVPLFMSDFREIAQFNLEIVPVSSGLSATSISNSLFMPQDKEKSHSLYRKIMMKTKSLNRTYITGLVFILGIILLWFHFQENKDPMNFIALEKDRSSSYNVKILPADMSDTDLNSLPKDSFSYLTMIDAGSSGCRAHVYKYGKLGSLNGPLYVLPQHVSKKVKPGLSSFAGSPEDAGRTLADLVAFIREQVPEADWTVTPIWLKATAGLRMLEPSKSDAILKSIREFLGDKNSSPFLFRPSWAGIISGNEEGGCGWIAYNYLKKLIGPKKTASVTAGDTFAVVEMGGASAQVTQQAPSRAEAAALPSDYVFRFSVAEEDYTLYTHSYLGFGAEQARQQLNTLLSRESTAAITTSTAAATTAAAMEGGGGGVARINDPCLQRGFSRSSSAARTDVYDGPLGAYYNISGAATEAGTCSAALKPIFDVSSYALAPSNLLRGKAAADKPQCGSNPTPFSFHCTHQPAFVAASKNFLVFENFYYASSALGVLDAHSTVPGDAAADQFVDGALHTTPGRVLQAANHFCGLPWSEATSTYPLDKQSKDVNVKMCFVGSYAYSLLVDGLGVSPSKEIVVQKDVGSSEIEWALGAAYKEAANFLKRTNLRPV